ncbi:MAG TPA: hypothetical protein P5211_03330 [Anaerolineae bacterium]|nr:hypothetical protein [Anaerolineae bacterium]
MTSPLNRTFVLSAFRTILHAMKKWRTPIVLALVLLDVGVIGVLGYTLLNPAIPATPAVAEVPACVQIVLSDLPPYLSPAVAWETDALTVKLTAFYAAPEPPEESAQLLWEALDSLQRATAVGCVLPPEVTLLLQAHTQTHSLSHIARLAGADITAWAGGTLSETELTQRGAYWRVSD